MEKIVESFELYGKQYRLETGELAKQATGAVLVTQGETTVLVTAVVSKQERDYDFFPLTVDFIEKMYAVGRIPGGYLKREARPSDKGTLTARMIDRPIRPGFPDGFKQEVHIVATTLVVDSVNPPDTICVAGASAALLAGGAPFDGPAACVRIGRDVETGEFIVNPTFEESAHSDLELTIAGTADYISMVEAGADEISEEDMLAAMTFGQEAIAAFCEKQAAFLAKVNPEPLEYTIRSADPCIAERVEPFFDRMSAALKDADKLARMGKVEDLKAEIKETQFSDEERVAWGSDIAAACKALEKKAMRAMVIATGERADGRAADEIRPLHIVPGYLPRVHGSGLFQRGQTQVLSVVTLGMLNEWQRLDTIDPAEGKRYMHQYNFPPYCTGEAGRMGAPKRREIGHGALAERALLPVIPSEDDFPYAIRVVSEVLESNGSSSMASTCGSTLGAHGCRRAYQGARVRYCHGPHQGGRRRGHPLRHPGPGGLPGRHGLQGVRHGEGHHGPADGQQGEGPFGGHPGPRAQAGPRRASVHPGRHAPDHRRAARAAARHRPAHRDHSHPRGQDPRRHRVRRQGGPRHPGRDGRVHRHPGRRHHPHRRRGRPCRRGRQGHDPGHRERARSGRGVRRRGRGHQGLRRVRRSSRPARTACSTSAAWPTAAWARWRTCWPWATS